MTDKRTTKYLETLSDAYDLLADFGKFKHLFAEDEAEKTLAKIRQTVGYLMQRSRISFIKDVKPPTASAIKTNHSSGKFVSIRPCGDKYEDKTFLGICIGEAALSSNITIDDDSIICNFAHYNPAILIPELGEVIYGCESWWSVIESENQLEQITDLDIENVWYVKALKSLSKAETPSQL